MMVTLLSERLFKFTCVQLFSAIFDLIFFKLVGNKDNEFEFQ